MGLVKSSLTFSLYAQVITTLVGFLALIYKLAPQDKILRDILSLETICLLYTSPSPRDRG